MSDRLNKREVILKHDDLLWLGKEFKGIDEIRFFNCCLVDVDQRLTLNDVYYPVNIDRYAHKGGLTVGQAFTEIESICLKFKHEDLNVKLPDGSIWVTSLIYDFIKDTEAKVLKIKWNRNLVPYLSGNMLPGEFCYYDPRLDSSSNSRSYKLAELIQRNLFTIRVNGSCKIPVQQIREFTGTENMYPEYKDLNRYVIQPALDDLTKHIGVKLQIDKKKRGSTTITFRLQRLMSALPEESVALQEEI
jgi:hypothetical protein